MKIVWGVKIHKVWDYQNGWQTIMAHRIRQNEHDSNVVLQKTYNNVVSDIRHYIMDTQHRNYKKFKESIMRLLEFDIMGFKKQFFMRLVGYSGLNEKEKARVQLKVFRWLNRLESEGTVRKDNTSTYAINLQ